MWCSGCPTYQRRHQTNPPQLECNCISSVGTGETVGGCMWTLQLYSSANFPGPSIVAPLAESSASASKWQCFSVSASQLPSCTQHTLSQQSTFKVSCWCDFFPLLTKKNPSSFLLFCSLGFSHLHFIPPYLFQVPSPLDMAGNKSLSCNLALPRACNDRDQKMATVEVRWGGLKNLISAQNESLSWSSMLWNTRGNGVSLQRVGLSQKFKHPKGFSNKLYSYIINLNI